MADLRTVLERYTPNIGADLRAVLERYTPNIELGGPKKEINLKGLCIALEAVQKKNMQFFWICVVMVLLLFIGMVVTTFLRFDSSIAIKVFNAAFGVTASGLLYWMFRLWRYKFLMETLIAIALNGSDDALRQLLLITKNDLLGNMALTGGASR